MSKLEDQFFDIEGWAEDDYLNGREQSEKEFIKTYIETFKDYCDQINSPYDDEDLELAKEDAIDAYENVYEPAINKADEFDYEYNSRHTSNYMRRTWSED